MKGIACRRWTGRRVHTAHLVPAIPLSSAIIVRDFRSEGVPFSVGGNYFIPDVGEQISLFAEVSYGCESFWRKAEEE